MWDGSSLGESGVRLDNAGDPDGLVERLDRPGCSVGRCGVSGAEEVVEEREVSSLLDGRPSSIVGWWDDAGFAASDNDRDFGEGLNGGPRERVLSLEESTLGVDSPCSFRWESCSLSLLAKGIAGKLCDTVEEVVEGVISWRMVFSVIAIPL